MNIKQIEQQSGMSRANIRYYEQEGLLAPVRQENGYRDYSEADLAALQKIRLLRELGLPIETIRRLQAGEESLPDVLAARMDELQAGAAAAQAAREVCASLRRAGAQYETLNAPEYLRQAERLAAQARQQPAAVAAPVAERPAPARPAARPASGYTPQPLPDGWKQVAPMPWRRYAARTLDLLLYGLAVDLVLFGWLRVFPPKHSPAQWALSAAALAVMVLVEPLLLMTLGTTPGKWLLGIRLVWRGGRKFFYSDGLVRTAQVAVQGLGLNIPVLKLFCLWRAWRNEKHGTYHPWEDPAEWYLVREKARPALRLALCAAAGAAMVFCSVAVQQQGYLPAAYTPGKGVTQEQFVQNFNAYANYYEASRGLNPDGSWVPPQYESYYTVELADGTEQTYKAQLPAPLVIETDAEGYVTRVSHVWQSSPYDQIITAPAQRMQLCLLSFAAAQPGVTGWRLTMQDDLYNRQIGSGVHSTQFTVDGVRVRYTVTTQGFMVQELEDTGMIWRMDSAIDPDAFVRIEFVLEKLPG